MKVKNRQEMFVKHVCPLATLTSTWTPVSMTLTELAQNLQSSPHAL